MITAQVLAGTRAFQEFAMDDRRHREVERRYRADPRVRMDYGQAVYSTDWG
jgi:hypothetical protein